MDGRARRRGPVASRPGSRAPGEAGRAIECYEKVLRYFELTFLPEDIYDDIFEPYRSEHDRGDAHMLNRLMRLYLHDNQLPTAHAVALRALACDPYAVEAVKTLVMVYLSQGDTAAAVRPSLHELSQVMARHRGCAPNDELRTLRQAIQSGDLRSMPPGTAMGPAAYRDGTRRVPRWGGRRCGRRSPSSGDLAGLKGHQARITARPGHWGTSR